MNLRNSAQKNEVNRAAMYRWLLFSQVLRSLTMEYVWTAVIGFVVGLVARAVLPGTQSVGIILTAVLGVAGSFVASFAGRALGFYAPGDAAGFMVSVIGAAVLLFVVGNLKGPAAEALDIDKK
jgi:uncharacterized membrane protein YeaQ/YmgE (transglycosylase-associated protein family)